ILIVGSLAVCAVAYCRLWPRARLWWLDIAGLGLVAIALVDFRISQLMGTRLEWNVLALGNSPRMIWRMAAPYVPAVAGALIVICAIYFLAVKKIEGLVWRSASSEKKRLRYTGFWPAAACFGLLGVVGLVTNDSDKAQGQAGIRLAQSSPIWKRWTNPTMSREKFLRTVEGLGIGWPRPGSTWPRPDAYSRRDLNVVLVVMESSFNKHLSLFGGSEETQPLLSKYRDRMELFPNFF